jgi:AraC-like DNA-binding protein
VLTKRLLLETDGIRIEDVDCLGDGPGWSPPEEVAAYSIVFIRRGCFRRRVRGSEEVIDSAVVYFERPGDEQQIAHPVDGGDACTLLVFREDPLASITGDEPSLPEAPVFSSPEIDLAHRLMISRCRRDPDGFEPSEVAVSVAAALLDRAGHRGVGSGRPATETARRRIVDQARAAISAQPSISLFELARAVAVSPHHLSRIFRAGTGETVSRYRNRVRVRMAMERLADGERDLAGLAGDLRFADHAHLVRAVRREAGDTPSALRAALSK